MSKNVEFTKVRDREDICRALGILDVLEDYCKDDAEKSLLMKAIALIESGLGLGVWED